MGKRRLTPAEARQVAEHQRERFNRLVATFDVPQPPDVMARLAEIVADAAIREGEAVLDVGTGVGVLIPLIAAYRPGRILACDLAEKMLERVQEKFPEVSVHRGDITTLPLPPASIDVVFMNAVYGNVADKEAARRNAARMLRPGGRLVVSHPEGRAFVDALRTTSDLFIEAYPTREEFVAALQPLGLEVILYRDEPRLYLMIARKP